jgi:hypothetical protein
VPHARRAGTARASSPTLCDALTAEAAQVAAFTEPLAVVEPVGDPYTELDDDTAQIAYRR